LLLRAETFAACGDAGTALATASDAIEIARRSGDVQYEAELVRLCGDQMLSVRADSRDVVDDAERAFVQALEIARGQVAKSLELRAATSLARLWHLRGRTGEARELLAGTYGWFTEGHDTGDLRDAATLLDELG
jgi:predicted ATPase